MPFGVRNGAQTFQRFINHVLGEFDFVFLYVDDILISSSNNEDHKRHLRLVLKRLSELGVSINPDKCELGVPKIEFLGRQIDETGIKPSPGKVQAISDYPPPTSVKQLQRFLGMVNYYHRFIPKIAQLNAELYDHLTVLGKTKSKDFPWPENCNDAFVKIKEALANNTLLNHP